MQLDEIFLEIAKRDLEAAKVLYAAKLYPQAVFYLQQSVEKTFKSLNLMLNVIKRDELLKVGHNPLKILKKSIDKQKKSLMVINNATEKIPELKEIAVIKDINAPKLYEDLNNADDLFIEILREKRELIFVSKDDIEHIIEYLRQVELESEEINKNPIDIPETNLKQIKENYIDVLMDIFDNFQNFFPEKVSEKELKDHIDSLPIGELLKEFIPLIYNIAYISSSLLYLSIITFPHAIIARYPQNGLNPLEIYTDKLPIINLFGECTEIMNKTIKKIEYMRKEGE